MEQMQAAYASLVSRPVVNSSLSIYGTDTRRLNKAHPRVITFGGDHTIVRSACL
jgi:arginase family enzyme